MTENQNHDLIDFMDVSKLAHSSLGALYGEMNAKRKEIRENNKRIHDREHSQAERHIKEMPNPLLV